MGPYNCECARWKKEKAALRDKHSTDFFLRNHPGMYIDFPPDERADINHYYCGFSSMQQLLGWFNTDELNLFQVVGFCLVILAPNGWIEGRSKSQIFFRYNEAKVLDIMEISTCLASI